MKDLGAESLDFLDINYRLEQAFGIKTARHFVLEHIEEMFGEGSAIDENSQLTDKAIALLKIRLGDNLSAELHAGMDMDEVPPLVTVEGMARGREGDPGHPSGKMRFLWAMKVGKAEKRPPHQVRLLWGRCDVYGWRHIDQRMAD